jgi:Rad3-related DNA helicase
MEQNTKLLFMSGTLPAKWFMFATGLQPGVDIQVIPFRAPPRQIASWVIGTGVQGWELATDERHRGEADQLEDYGRTIQRILPEIPGGSLIFFPSYAVQHDMLLFWMSRGIIVRTGNPNRWRFHLLDGTDLPLFETTKDDEEAAIRDYKTVATDHPAILTAVFKARASEGEDYPNQLARAVFILGIPFAPPNDEDVKQEMEFYDQVKSGYGQMWYKLMALTAVSQACGRGIRDLEFDYCIYMFLDQRYRRTEYWNALSDWIPPSLRRAKTMPEVLMGVHTFFTGRS